LILHVRVSVLTVGLTIAVALATACVISGDSTPARPLLTPTGVRAQGSGGSGSPPTPIPVQTRDPLVISAATATRTTAPVLVITATSAPAATPRPPAATPTAASPSTSTPKPAAGPRYPVQQGDTLSALSRRFGVPVGEIASANGLASDAGLRTGESLALPSGAWSDRLTIRVTQPQPSARVRSPIVVRGTAATFEAQVLVEVVDSTGTRLAQTSIKAASPDAGQHGPFEATLNLPASSAERPATVRVYWLSPRDGTPADEVRVPVTIAPAS
jgi:LysM repeat protein